jgi:hypothetical protein
MIAMPMPTWPGNIEAKPHNTLAEIPPMHMKRASPMTFLPMFSNIMLTLLIWNPLKFSKMLDLLVGLKGLRIIDILPYHPDKRQVFPCGFA